MDVPDAEIIEVATRARAFRLLDARGADVMVLDGEAQRLAGWECAVRRRTRLTTPAVLLIIGRADDGWLATWSRADAVVSDPIDAIALATSWPG